VENWRQAALGANRNHLDGKHNKAAVAKKKCRRKYESMAEPCIISKHNNAESKQCRDKTVFKLCLNSIQNAIKVLTCSFLQQTILLAASS
jgi:hypothetical protein